MRAAAEGGRRHNRVMEVARTTLRSRIVGTMVLVATVALSVSGTLLWVLEERSIHHDADRQLDRVHTLLTDLAVTGTDPGTGAPFTSPSRVLHAYLSATVLGPTQGAVALLGSRVYLLAPRGVTLRPEEDPELMSYATAHATGADAVVDTLRTARGTYRVLVSPITTHGEQGALVYVIDLRAPTSSLRQSMALYALSATVSLAAVAVLARVAVGRLLRPIGELRQAAEAIDERNLSQRVPVRGRDDLAALASAFNRMVGRVERSVEAQRSLTDDVGHELRTPITIVRGHLELVDPHDPEDVTSTTHLALEELDRMGVLVNDMLTLARSLDSQHVRPQDHDVATLTRTVLDKARALGERRWLLEGTAQVTARVDQQRLTQAWLQLAANAVRYSDPGSTVALGSAATGFELRLWVRDEGTGIAPQDLERIRQRFVRTAQARARSSGSGLGLPIVENIVAAHGGRLDIASEPGTGSVFTMVLPWSPDEAAGPTGR